MPSIREHAAEITLVESLLGLLRRARRRWLGSVESKIGWATLRNAKDRWRFRLAPVLRSVLLQALQESDSRLRRELAGLELLQSQVHIGTQPPR